VAYFYNEEIAKFYYYKDHPMKPLRMAMTQSLIESFDIYKHLDVYRSRKATKEELLKFHHPDYIEYLSNYICKDALRSIDYGFVGEEVPEH
jgi:acetoin utilization deacetylase AcuC-like enzyme